MGSRTSWSTRCTRETRRPTCSLLLLRELLPTRPNLRVVLMSATVQAETFTKYFGDCEVLNAKGRTFPVEDPRASARADGPRPPPRLAVPPPGAPAGHASHGHRAAAQLKGRSSTTNCGTGAEQFVRRGRNVLYYSEGTYDGFSKNVHECRSARTTGRQSRPHPAAGCVTSTTSSARAPCWSIDYGNDDIDDACSRRSPPHRRSRRSRGGVCSLPRPDALVRVGPYPRVLAVPRPPQVAEAGIFRCRGKADITAAADFTHVATAWVRSSGG